MVKHDIRDSIFLTEKLPNVKTCPSIRSTAVWLLPAVTWTLGLGRACTRVGEPLAGRNIEFRHCVQTSAVCLFMFVM